MNFLKSLRLETKIKGVHFSKNTRQVLENRQLLQLIFFFLDSKTIGSTLSIIAKCWSFISLFPYNQPIWRSLYQRDFDIAHATIATTTTTTPIASTTSVIVTTTKTAKTSKIIRWRNLYFNYCVFSFDSTINEFGLIFKSLPDLCGKRRLIQVNKINRYPDVTWAFGLPGQSHGSFYFSMLVIKQSMEIWIGITNDREDLNKERGWHIEKRKSIYAYCNHNSGHSTGFPCGGIPGPSAPEEYGTGDVIGIKVDLYQDQPGSITLFKNNKLQCSFNNLPIGHQWFPCVGLDCPGDSVQFVPWGFKQQSKMKIEHEKILPIQKPMVSLSLPSPREVELQDKKLPIYLPYKNRKTSKSPYTKSGQLNFDLFFNRFRDFKTQNNQNSNTPKKLVIN